MRGFWFTFSMGCMLLASVATPAAQLADPHGGLPGRVAYARVATSPPAAAEITLSDPGLEAAAAPPGAIVHVTLTDYAGAPLAGREITATFTTNGLLPLGSAAREVDSHTRSTDASGIASFPFRGGPVTATFVASARARPLTIQLTGTTPDITATEINGRFYGSDGSCTFSSSPGTPLRFVESFPTMDFAGQPFTNFFGAGASRVAAGGTIVGTGNLAHFNAAFMGNLLVRTPGKKSFTVLTNNRFALGIGGDADPTVRQPAMGKTALNQYPVMGPTAGEPTVVTVYFPNPGYYPYELDYAACHAGAATLRMSTAGVWLTALSHPYPAPVPPSVPTVLYHWTGTVPGTLDAYVSSDTPLFTVRGPFTVVVAVSAVNPNLAATAQFVTVDNVVTDQSDLVAPNAIPNGILLGPHEGSLHLEQPITDNPCQVGCKVRFITASNIKWAVAIEQ